MTRPAFVFVHGYWHNSGTWAQVIPALKARGYAAHALDLPGAGANAKLPGSFLARDAAAFATEPSPNAAVTQEERTRAVIDVVKAAGAPVVLVGHSMGGATISDVAENVPESVATLVYLTAFLLAPGVPPIRVIQHETMKAALVPSLFRADPTAVGALRLDPRSEDANYRAKFKAAFYGDVGDAELNAFLPSLHCDEPLSTAVRPSAVTAGRMGSIPRHYIRCTADRAITIEGQDYMLSSMDAAFGATTVRHTLAASHSPFLSQPAALVEILAGVAG